MPTCPGCGLCVPYQQLDTHERYCDELADETEADAQIEELDRRLTEMERRLNRRLLKIEARIRHEVPERNASGDHANRGDEYRR